MLEADYQILTEVKFSLNISIEQHNPNQNPKSFLIEIDKVNLKFIWKHKGTGLAKQC